MHNHVEKNYKRNERIVVVVVVVVVTDYVIDSKKNRLACLQFFYEKEIIVHYNISFNISCMHKKIFFTIGTRTYIQLKQEANKIIVHGDSQSQTKSTFPRKGPNLNKPQHNQE